MKRICSQCYFVYWTNRKKDAKTHKIQTQDELLVAYARNLCHSVRL